MGPFRTRDVHSKNFSEDLNSNVPLCTTPPPLSEGAKETTGFWTPDTPTHTIVKLSRCGSAVVSFYGESTQAQRQRFKPSRLTIISSSFFRKMRRRGTSGILLYSCTKPVDSAQRTLNTTGRLLPTHFHTSSFSLTVLALLWCDLRSGTKGMFLGVL